MPGETCETAESISVGDCVTGSTEWYTNDHECNPNHHGPDRVYELVLSSERDLTITGEGDFEADWTLSSTCGNTGDIFCEDSAGIHVDPSCGNIEHNGGGCISWNGTLAAGTYYLWVDGQYQTNYGNYALEIKEQRGGDTCDSYESLQYGACITGTTEGYLNDHQCNPGHNGADRVFGLTLNSEKHLTVIGEADYPAGELIIMSKAI